MPKRSAGHIAPIMAKHAITTVTARKNHHRYKYHYDNGDDFQQGSFHTHILDPFYAHNRDLATSD